MPAISEMSYGYSSEGTAAYLEQIKAIVLQEAKEIIADTSAIETVCDTEWEGKAKENFKINLKNTANNVSTNFDSLYNILASEVAAIEAAMANKDENLIEE